MFDTIWYVRTGLAALKQLGTAALLWQTAALLWRAAALEETSLGQKKIPRPGRVRRTLVAGHWGTFWPRQEPKTYVFKKPVSSGCP
jgi:hypothetical protein